MIWFTFFLASLATWRLTHLVVEDTLPLIARPRNWIVQHSPGSNFSYLLGCVYCSSVWVAAAVTAGLDLWTDISVPQPFLFGSALSIIAAFGETVIDWLDRFGLTEEV